MSSMVKNNICVIGVYFGALPNHFPLWLKSAQTNCLIDFLLFTDTDMGNLPHNVRNVQMTLREMKALAEEKLQMKVSLERPYKCCDFKPVYGVIFRDYIEDYEYWAHCDFDLIFGDLSYFLQKYSYRQYDRFLNLGHLSFFKNTDEVNQYYKQEGSACGDYRTVLTQDRNFAFDEINGINKIYAEHGYPCFTKRIFADIATVYHRFRLALDDKNYDYQVFYWENGHVYRAYWENGSIHKEEFIYIHFKKRPNFELIGDIQDAQCFFITNRGFFQKSPDSITKAMLQEMNPFYGRLYEAAELFRFKLRIKIRRVQVRLKNATKKW